MSRTVAIAGGSGGLGRALVDAFMSSQYQILVLARKANSELEDIGVRVLPVNYSDPESIAQLLDEHKVDTVISTISNYDNASPVEIGLIKAADLAKSTRRYIPSIWSGFDYDAEHGDRNPMAAPRLRLIEALRETGLGWTTVYPGIFLDYYTLAVPSYVRRTALAVDVDGNAAAIPGDGTYPVYFTHTSDIAKYTVALLGLSQWEQKYYLYADRKTWNEVVAIAEAAKGAQFAVAYDSVEKLGRGEVTELPGHKAVYQTFFDGADGKAMFQKVMSGAALSMAQVRMVYEGPCLNDIFPDIRPLTVQEALCKDT